MFYSALRDIRKRKGFTIREVSERSGVSAAYISQIENNQRSTPSPDILYKLSEGLQSSYNELMRLAGYLEHPAERDEQRVELISLRHFLRENAVSLDGVELSEADKQWIEDVLTVLFRNSDSCTHT